MRGNKDRQLIAITCDKGMNQSTHPRLSPPGTFDLVQNMRIRGNGILEKRPGTRAIGSVSQDDLSPTFTESLNKVPSFIATDGNVGFIGASDGTIYAHQELDDALVATGRFSTCQPVRKRVSFTAGAERGSGYSVGGKPAQVAVNSSGYLLAALVDDAGGLNAYIETPEGVRVMTKRVSSELIAHCRVVAQGATLCLFWNETDALSSTDTLYGQTFTISSGDVAASAVVTVASGLVPISRIDVAPSDGQCVIAYTLEGSPKTVTIARLNGLVLVASATFTTTEFIAPSLFSNDTNVFFAWFESSALTSNYRVYLRSDMSSVLGATSVPASGSGGGPALMADGGNDSTVAFVVRHRHISGAIYLTSYGTLTSGGTVTTAGTLTGIVPISKPDELARFWAVACQNSANCTIAKVALLRVFPTQAAPSAGGPSGAVIELALDDQLNADTARLGWDGFVGANSFFSTAAVAADRIYFPAPFVLNAVGERSFVRYEMLQYTASAVRSDSDLEPESHRSITREPGAIVVAGQPVEAYAQPGGIVVTSSAVDRFAGFGSAEIGFLAAPTIFSLTAAADATGVEAGTYTYVAVREWADARGQRHQSAPSAPVSVTFAVESEVTIAHDNGSSYIGSVMPGMRNNVYTMMQTPWTVFYRTTNGGTEFHRLPGIAADSTDYVDDNPDDEIADEGFIYTAGEVLPNVLAPSCRFTRLVAGRIWCGGLWSRDQIECSKLIVPDEQPAFTGDASHRLSVGREVTALATLDDQLVVFTDDAIYAVAGEGPNDQGIGGFVVRSVSVGVGCTDERSIAETDIGVFFRSRIGWYLLPRGFGPPQYVGAAIQDTAADYPIPLATAVLDANGTRLVRMLVADDDGATRVFAFDLNSGQWFVDTFFANLGELGVWPEGFVLCRASLDPEFGGADPILIEDADQDGDGAAGASAGSHISQVLRTNWIMPAGPGGGSELNQLVVAVIAAEAASLSVQIDPDSSTSAHLAAWSLAASDDVTYRYLVPALRSAVGYRMLLFDSAVGGQPTRGVKFVAVTLESVADGGLRLSNESEKA
ncbi:MAG TPA: hypothetical protein VGK73_28010 [Polyangiaceae bacterium]